MTWKSLSRPDSRFRFDAFVYGSLVVLLLCLCTAALFFSATYLTKERSRAKISLEQLSYFFDFQYRAMTEEMWTANYQAIDLRVGTIAREFGKATHRLVLADDKGACVYASDSAHAADRSDPVPCRVPDALQRQLPQFRAGHPQPAFTFDERGGQYVYMVPLSVGAVLKGYLFATISDPYEFYRGGNFALATKIFVIPIASVIFVWLAWLLLAQMLILRPYLSSLVATEKQQALGELAAQVAHDIRSPLAALAVAERELAPLPEETRIMIRSAVQRIRDIANHVIDRNQSALPPGEIEPNNVSPRAPESTLLYPVIEGILTEKRLQFRSRLGLQIEGEVDEHGYGLFATLDPVELKRVLSNLINNSVEALHDQGSVTVSLRGSNSGIEILVRDTGRGIPADVLPRLTQVGATFGKEGGLGLGLHHASRSCDAWGGKLEISSQAGIGTSVTLRIPRATPPAWFLNHISFTAPATVVILDDDQSIHRIWQSRLEALRARSIAVDDVHLSTPTELREWRRSASPAGDVRYLIDYELLGFEETGLDLIEELGIAGQSALVTSRFEEAGIRARCARLKIPLIPKGMAGFVPIQAVPPAEKWDAILIDNDALVRLAWAFTAKRTGKRFRGLPPSPDLVETLETIDRSTPIYVDADLGDGARGETVLKSLHEKGFGELYLATGYEASTIEELPWLRGVLGKEPPWSQPAGK